MKKWIVLIIIVVVLGAAGFFVYLKTRPAKSSTTTSTNTTPTSSTPTTTPTPTPTLTQPQSQYALPIANFLTGQTKKPFGIYITPQTSPVQPEKFTGYHTGVDIEEVQDNTDVPVYAINDGVIKFSGRVGGYGGVIIYSTQIDNQDVTILYGHIRLLSAEKKVGDTVSKGEKLAVLGTGYSSETDGERKHLHFSIHKGSAIVYLGYVQNKADLSAWLNPDDVVK
jgi:murein DD-endopeptidase MepM/ murein hydrolase activator NlpD